jgi:transposase
LDEYSERVERSFAHVCETGGARRTWLRGLETINKRYRLTVAAHNLGLILRRLFGTGKPREFVALRALQTLSSAAFATLTAIMATVRPLTQSHRHETAQPRSKHQPACVAP